MSGVGLQVLRQLESRWVESVTRTGDEVGIGRLWPFDGAANRIGSEHMPSCNLRAFRDPLIFPPGQGSSCSVKRPIK